ncbi:MAG: S9 family peptidase [Acidobacteriaceae bacterium]|nr:S9 family peptidase [Acidobacteriaceae bacterium]MBV9780146.1 S9 family peptidase [Acidobacteriaceae bacterium]
MRLAVLCAFFGGVVSVSPQIPAKAPFTFDAMMKLVRIDDPQLSPDGKLVAFTAQTIDVAGDKKITQIYVVPVEGGGPQQLTKEGSSNTRPRWTPDSKRILFISDRSNGQQVWSMTPNGSDQKSVTNVPTGADGVTISPDGKLILFVSDVYPGCEPANASSGVEYDPACNKTNLDQEAASKMNARVYTALLYRHWTQYEGKRRTHLLVQRSDGSGKIWDLTPGDPNTPPFSLGGPEQYAFSPDSVDVTYVAITDSDPSTSTNSDLFTVHATGGEAKRITTNPGADQGPLYSPDGKYLAYRTQIRGGYESDQWRLAVLELATGKMNTLTDSLDRWVENYTWSPDSKNIFFTTDDHGTSPLLMMPVAGGAIRTIAQGPTTVGGMQFTPDEKIMIYTEQSGSRPIEINKAMSKGGSGVPLTHLNDAVFDQYQLTPFETISVDGADGAKVESFVVKPPGFNASVKYPALFLIHGGPESEWGEVWTYRWNAQVFAAAGYVVIMPNPHGSVGYGQSFTDAVNGDWGGRPYDDIMATVDYAGNLPYIDKDRMVAAGGSYGGYMIDWVLGHTDRFKALVSHAGVYDLESEAGTTEELWFPKWEFQGFPWENRELYEKWSPSSFAKNFKTPTLVTHGELDYRVPAGQGEELFTALQELKIPSKLVQFPDEGHWILKPQNSQFWYTTVIDWLNEYTKKTPADVKPAQSPN